MIGKKNNLKKNPNKTNKKKNKTKLKNHREKNPEPICKKIHTHPKLKINEEKSKTRLSLFFFFTVIIYQNFISKGFIRCW